MRDAGTWGPASVGEAGRMALLADNSVDRKTGRRRVCSAIVGDKLDSPHISARRDGAVVTPVGYGHRFPAPGFASAPETCSRQVAGERPRHFLTAEACGAGAFDQQTGLRAFIPGLDDGISNMTGKAGLRCRSYCAQLRRSAEPTMAIHVFNRISILTGDCETADRRHRQCLWGCKRDLRQNQGYCVLFSTTVVDRRFRREQGVLTP